MNKEEMIRKLDIVMKQHLEHAIWCHDEGLRIRARAEIDTCYGIAFSASILELINSDEFDNINHILAYTGIKW